MTNKAPCDVWGHLLCCNLNATKEPNAAHKHLLSPAFFFESNNKVSNLMINALNDVDIRPMRALSDVDAH